MYVIWYIMSISCSGTRKVPDRGFRYQYQYQYQPASLTCRYRLGRSTCAPISRFSRTRWPRASGATEERDRRIRIAVEKSGWEGCPTVEEIADVTGLGEGELREIAAGPPHPAQHRRAVSEVDEPLSWDDDQRDRVLALADVAPQAQWWELEYASFQDNPQRRHRFYSVQPDVYDVDPAQSWEVLYAGTGEVYARELITVSLQEIQVQSRDEPPAPEGWTMRDGALNGRCVLLGRLPNLELVRDTLNAPAAVVARGRGGLARVYGRINLTNRILRAGFRPSAGFGDYGDPAGGLERAGDTWTGSSRSRRCCHRHGALSEVHPGWWTPR